MAKKKMVPKKKPAPKKKPKKPMMYKGKSMKPGGGGAFAKMTDAMKAQGMSEDHAKAIAAAAGRKKYGPKKFAQMAATGKKRVARKKAAKK